MSFAGGPDLKNGSVLEDLDVCPEARRSRETADDEMSHWALYHSGLVEL